MSDGGPRTGFFAALTNATEHAGYTILLLVRGVGRGIFPPSPLRHARRVIEQMHVQMVKSLGVVTVTAAFSGMILALQTGETLQRYGVESQLGGIVGASMAREMGPFIASIILAATVGAAIAAELGTMRVSEEIDALELMNIEPVAFLVAPRVVALAVTSVLLTVLVDAIGVVGGAVVANTQFGTNYASFFESARSVLADETMLGSLSKDLYSGLTKALVFGFVNAAVACAAGLRAHGGALGVGRAVRHAVIASVLLTLVVGYVITWVFWA